jgi:hypothetical protein
MSLSSRVGNGSRIIRTTLHFDELKIAIFGVALAWTRAFLLPIAR